MKHTVQLLSLILAVAMLLSACAPAAAPTAAHQAAAATKVPATPQQVQVTEADQGKYFTLNPGDTLIVVLDSNPSTGYSWEIRPVDHPVLSPAGEPVFKAASDKLGAPGKTTFTLNAVTSGSQTLTLLYQRSFEKDAQPLKIFTINVTVSSSASTSKPPAAVPNPASKYCLDQGNTTEIRTAADGSQYGVCKFPNGIECDEWAYYRGECKAGK
jgi:predicted secreted protein